MSKSRGNVVNPDQYLDQHGADVFRMYMMFLGPYEEGGDFRDEGIAGVRRFLEAIWRLVHEQVASPRSADAPLPPALQRATHRAIKKVGEDLDNLRYNTAIAALMTLLNEVRRLGPADRWVIETLVIMVAPFAPHISEELWEALGHKASIFTASWPGFDPALTVDETAVIVVQVNGKVRGRIEVPRNAPEDDVVRAALADAAVRAHIDGKQIRRRVVVPGRLVNLVV
jgi:leucyl-tRNA synthetase